VSDRPARGLALALAAVTASAWPAEATLRTATVAARSGRYDEAIAAFEAWARENPDEPRGHRSWVKTLLELGRYAEAERVSRRLVDAGSPELLNVLGESLAAVGKLDAADAIFSRAIAAAVPDALVARANRGLLRERRGDQSGAEADYSSDRRLHARASPPRSWWPWVRPAASSAPATCSFKDALRAFDQAADADPGDPSPRTARGSSPRSTIPFRARP
jgi:tetratricopeptide (TPR) repeat protein